MGISFYIFSHRLRVGCVLGQVEGRAQPSGYGAVPFLLPQAGLWAHRKCPGLPAAAQGESTHHAQGDRGGVQIFIFVFFKKLVSADHLAIFVDNVFYAPVVYGMATIWLAVFSYFLQLYFDSNGYSDIAVGVSKMFGYR